MKIPIEKFLERNLGVNELQGRFYTRSLLGFSAEIASIYICKFPAAAQRRWRIRGARTNLFPFLRHLNVLHRLKPASRVS